MRNPRQFTGAISVHDIGNESHTAARPSRHEPSVRAATRRADCTGCFKIVATMDRYPFAEELTERLAKSVPDVCSNDDVEIVRHHGLTKEPSRHRAIEPTTTNRHRRAAKTSTIPASNIGPASHTVRRCSPNSDGVADRTGATRPGQRRAAWLDRLHRERPAQRLGTFGHIA